MLYGRLVHVGETLTDLQFWGCELYKNAFGGRAPPGPTGGAITLPRPSSRYKGREGGNGKERVGIVERGGRGRKEKHEGYGGKGMGREREGRNGKGRQGKGEAGTGR